MTTTIDALVRVTSAGCPGSDLASTSEPIGYQPRDPRNSGEVRVKCKHACAVLQGNGCNEGLNSCEGNPARACGAVHCRGLAIGFKALRLQHVPLCQEPFDAAGIPGQSPAGLPPPPLPSGRRVRFPRSCGATPRRLVRARPRRCRKPFHRSIPGTSSIATKATSSWIHFFRFGSRRRVLDTPFGVTPIRIVQKVAGVAHLSRGPYLPAFGKCGAVATGKPPLITLRSDPGPFALAPCE